MKIFRHFQGKYLMNRPSFSKVEGWLLRATISYQNSSSMGIFFKIFQKFSELQDIINCKQKYFQWKGSFFWCLTFIFLKCQFPETIKYQSVLSHFFVYNNILISMRKEVLLDLKIFQQKSCFEINQLTGPQRKGGRGGREFLPPYPQPPPLFSGAKIFFSK